MSLGFKSDIFSYSKIIWKKDIDTKNIDNIKIIINKNISNLKYTIYQSSGMELNSNNFILKFPSKILILKRYWFKDPCITTPLKYIWIYEV